MERECTKRGERVRFGWKGWKSRGNSNPRKKGGGNRARVLQGDKGNASLSWKNSRRGGATERNGRGI